MVTEDFTVTHIEVVFTTEAIGTPPVIIVGMEAGVTMMDFRIHGGCFLYRIQSLFRIMVTPQVTDMATGIDRGESVEC